MAGTTTTPQGGADSGAAAQAQEKAQEVAGQAKEQAQQAAGQAKTQIKSQVDQRSTKVGEQVTSQASDIRSVADTLREKGQDKPAQYVEQAASKIEGLGSYLTQSNADRILHDVEDFARARPTGRHRGGARCWASWPRASSRPARRSATARAPASCRTRPTRPAYTTPPPLTSPTGVGVGGNTLSGGVPPAVPATPGVPRTGDGLGVPPTPTTGGL
jgi:hypothetical protein